MNNLLGYSAFNLTNASRFTLTSLIEISSLQAFILLMSWLWKVISVASTQRLASWKCLLELGGWRRKLIKMIKSQNDGKEANSVLTSLVRRALPQTNFRTLDLTIHH